MQIHSDELLLLDPHTSKPKDETYMFDSDTLIIFVKTLAGRTMTLWVDPRARVKDVKAMIYDRIDTTPDEFKLLLDERELDDRRMVSDYNIQEGSMLHMGVSEGTDENYTRWFPLKAWFK